MRSNHFLVHMLLLGVPLLASCDDPAGAGGSGGPPEVSLSAPTASDSLTSDSVHVSGTVTADRIITSVRFSLNGGPEKPIEIEPGRQVAFDTIVTGLELGVNEVEVRAYNGGDAPGRASTSFVVTDATTPTLEITAPASEALVARDSVRIQGFARDDRGVTTVHQSLDGGVEGAVEITPGPQVDFGFTLRPDPGEHMLVLRAEDGSGNSVADTLRFRTAVARVTIDDPATDTTLTAFITTLTGVVDTPVPVTRLTTRLNDGPEVDRCFVESPGYCSSKTDLHIGLSIGLDQLPQGESTLQLTAYGADGTILGIGRTHFTVAVPVKHYLLTYLGTLGGTDSQGTELNEKGEVVGWAFDAAGRQHAFVWANAQMLDIGTSLGTSSTAHGINGNGVVVGEYISDCIRAFRYVPGAAGPETIADSCGMRATDVNDAGVVLLWNVGSDTTPESGFILDPAGTHALQYGRFPPLVLLRINNRGQVFGLAHDSYGPTFYSTSAEPQVRNICPGGDANDRGDVTSQGCHFGPSSVTFDDGSFASIPEIGIRGTSAATAINNHGTVAGTYAYTSPQPRHAFLWDGTETLEVEYDSDDWRIDSVSDLNDAGVILAHATNTATGQKGAVLLRPRE